MELKATVIICTHNPRADHLRRTLDGLRCQTLPKELWELLLVDNASTIPLAGGWNLDWHPHSRHIREEELGLTAARLRGIGECKADLLILVDDDNILAPDFLSVALATEEAFPQIGAFGASTKGEFEVPPHSWIIPYLPGLAVSELDRDYWSNSEERSPATPFGAGLCVRRQVAEDYARKVAETPKRRALDRKGSSLASGGDSDLALCAVDFGMGTGRFASLRLTHLIPKERMTEEYIVKLFAGFAASSVILDSLRRKPQSSSDKSWLGFLRFGWQLLRTSPLERRIMLASREAGNVIKHLDGGLDQ
jgi:hypothetical protein